MTNAAAEYFVTEGNKTQAKLIEGLEKALDEIKKLNWEAMAQKMSEDELITFFDGFQKLNQNFAMVQLGITIFSIISQTDGK